MPDLAPRLRLNPLLLRRVKRSGRSIMRLVALAGFSHYPDYYVVLHSERVPATPLRIAQLHRLADAVGFPRDEVFLDAPAEVQR